MEFLLKLAVVILLGLCTSLLIFKNYERIDAEENFLKCAMIFSLIVILFLAGSISFSLFAVIELHYFDFQATWSPMLELRNNIIFFFSVFMESFFVIVTVTVIRKLKSLQKNKKGDAH